MLGRGGVARRSPDLERAWLSPEPLDRGAREQVRFSGSRADAEYGGARGGLEARVVLELPPRHVEQPAEVDVVAAALERRLHHVEVEPVVDAVDADGRAGERTAEARGVASVDVLVPLEPKVAPRDRHSPLLEERADDTADRAG